MAEIKPDEISAILRQQLSDSNVSAELEEVGTVLQVGDGIARVYGLSNVSSGELVEFENGVRAIALNLEEDNVGVVLMGESGNIKEGAKVRRTGKIASIRVGEGMLGRVVNTLGERFVDEGEDFFDTTYVKYGKAILNQPGRIAYCLFDAKLAERDLVYCLHREFEPIEAGSLERLAENLRIPAARLIATVERYNAAVQPGEFDPEVRDGKCTRGIDPPKSNWATTLDTPPFFAYPVTGGITFTLGGLRVDTRARVLDTEDRALPGLFAAGEIIGGLFHENYPGGASLIRSLVFGRIAGREAAKVRAEAAAV